MSGSKDEENPSFLPDHESGVRRMMADANGGTYRAYKSLQDAQADPCGVVVMEGDYGGQIYLVASASFVNCQESQLEEVLSYLDNLEWADPDGARLFFESKAVGEGIGGGMGGGLVVEGFWLHPRLQEHAAVISEVLTGRKSLSESA